MDLILEMNGFWNSPISIFYWGSFQNAHIWTRLGTRTKKRRNMQNKNFKKQKKSYFGAKNFACHLGEYVAIYILKI